MLRPPQRLDHARLLNDRQAFERAKAGERWQESGLVFTSPTGTALDARNRTREFKRHLAAAELPGELRYYDMRHAAASLLIAEDVPITVVSARFGPALTSTTLNNYAPALPAADRLTADAMERFLGEGVGVSIPLSIRGSLD